MVALPFPVFRSNGNCSTAVSKSHTSEAPPPLVDQMEFQRPLVEEGVDLPGMSTNVTSPSCPIVPARAEVNKI